MLYFLTWETRERCFPSVLEATLGRKTVPSHWAPGTSACLSQAPKQSRLKKTSCSSLHQQGTQLCCLPVWVQQLLLWDWSKGPPEQNAETILFHKDAGFFLYSGENSLNIEEVMGRGGKISIIWTGDLRLDIAVVLPDCLPFSGGHWALGKGSSLERAKTGDGNGMSK